MSFKIENPTFGTDFEMCVRAIDTRKLKSVVGLLGGTKNKPLELGKGCFRQEDNVMAE